jgi:hypothetical protein
MMWVKDIDYFNAPIYEVNPGDKICFAGLIPQIVTVPGDRFAVPLVCCECDNLEDKSNKTFRDMLYFCSKHVLYVTNEYDAIEKFKTIDLPFGQIIELNQGISKLKFAISEPEFLGFFVGRTKPINQFGAFLWLKSVIRIIEV